MVIDLIQAYGIRVIEGIAVNDIVTSGDTIPHGIAVTNEATGITKYFECVKDYFLPSKSYYKINDASDCSFCRRAMGYNGSANCLSCFQYCATNREVKKHRLIIKPPL